jgi:hypothetical protein
MIFHITVVERVVMIACFGCPDVGLTDRGFGLGYHGMKQVGLWNPRAHRPEYFLYEKIAEKCIVQ